jgi:DNA polymerase-4
MRARTIVHVDMDAFFTSIEQLDFTEYRNRPVVVGADPQGGKGRGVVSAASYEARTYGVHSAMPISTAYRLCPQAVFVRPRMQRYGEISARVMELLSEFSPLIEQVSIDEAFLDCTGTLRLIGSPPVLGRKIKDRIREVTTLSASVGIASNKSVAKIASDLQKPDGLVICAPGEEKRFLAQLPLSSLWGAGKKTVERLKKIGYTKIGEVADSDSERLVGEFGKMGLHLWELANGIDEREVSSSWERKSISEETTFEKDLGSDSHIVHVLFQIADSLSRKMRMQQLKGRTITLKIRLQGFETFTRSKTLSLSVDDTDTIREVSTELYSGFDRKGKRVRLIGIGVSNLNASDAEQLSLFDGTQSGEDRVRNSRTDELLDKMKRLYGGKVIRATFLSGPVEREDR